MHARVERRFCFKGLGIVIPDGSLGCLAGTLAKNNGLCINRGIALKLNPCSELNLSTGADG